MTSSPGSLLQLSRPSRNPRPRRRKPAGSSFLGPGSLPPPPRTQRPQSVPRVTARRRSPRPLPPPRPRERSGRAAVASAAAGGSRPGDSAAAPAQHDGHRCAGSPRARRDTGDQCQEGTWGRDRDSAKDQGASARAPRPGRPVPVQPPGSPRGCAGSKLGRPPPSAALAARCPRASGRSPQPPPGRSSVLLCGIASDLSLRTARGVPPF